MTAAGARLVAKAVLPYNPGELVYRSAAKAWIRDALLAP
jgi:hypothetical protein